jgi:hypothetical protein
LMFKFRPLAGKGKAAEYGLPEWSDRAFRPIVEDLLVAYSERSAKLDQKTIEGDIVRLRHFLCFLDTLHSQEDARNAPTTSKDISFETVCDFERWLGGQPSKMGRRLEEKRAALEVILASKPLPLNQNNKKKRRVNLTVLCQMLGTSANYITRNEELWVMVAAAADRAGVLMPERTTPFAAPAGRRKRDSGPTTRLNTKTIEEIYYTLSKTLRYIEKHHRHLLAENFVLAALSGARDRSVSKVKSAALTPKELQNLETACLAAMRRTKARLLEEGPARAARGRVSALPGEGDTAWGQSLDNLVAYLAAYAPCQALGQQPSASKHRLFINGLRAQREYRTGLSVARWLSPDRWDHFAFLIRMGCCEHAPLNLGSLLGLHVDETNPHEHCVRPSPTPNHKRIFFGKPRAGVDQTYVDVPARSALDLPGLIESVVELTRKLRAHAPQGLRNALWLYLSGKHGIRTLTEGKVVADLRKFITHEKILGDDGKPLQGFHFRRLRPTILGTTALDHGIDAAQERASHANPAQTLGYVNNPAADQRVHRTIEAAQSKAVTSVTTGFAQRPSEQDVSQLAAELGIQPGAAAEILLGQRDKLYSSCIDDRNGLGPEIAGRRCGRFQACLVCVNSVILERHLPRLITYHLHWLRMADEMDAAAWQETHALNCAIVEQHLTKFDPTTVERLTAEISSGPLVIGYRRYKQS